MLCKQNQKRQSFAHFDFFCTSQKIKFSTKNFLSKCDQTAVSATLTEEILREKLDFLCSAEYLIISDY